MTVSALYLRISKDKTGEELAVARQEKLIRKMLTERGWQAGPVYTDNSVSASGAKAKRPEYDKMLADWEEGLFDAISAYDLDRLYRHPVQLERLIDLADQRGLLLATCGGDADLSTDNGRLFARIKAAVAKSEGDTRDRRQKAKFAQKRENGDDFWRGRRPFGLTLEGKVVPVEAESIRRVCEMLLDGATLSACVAYLNSAGIETAWGNEWSRHPLRRILLHPRLIGKLEHEGELLPGHWDSVIDEDTWRAVGTVLRSRPAHQTKVTADAYLLAGIARCKVCDSKVYGTKRSREGKDPLFIYRCVNVSSHVSKSMIPTDELVIKKVIDLLSVPGAEEELSGGAPVAQLQALKQERVKEVQWWADWQQEAAEEGLMPSAYRKPKELHTARLAALDGTILNLQKQTLIGDALDKWSPVVVGGTDNRRAAWDALPIEKRRRVVATLWPRIVFHPSRKGARFDAGTIELVPAEETKALELRMADWLLSELTKNRGVSFQFKSGQKKKA